MSDEDRRSFLKLAATAGAVGTLHPLLAGCPIFGSRHRDPDAAVTVRDAAAADAPVTRDLAPEEEPPLSVAHFDLELEGTTDAIPGVVAVDCGQLTICIDEVDGVPDGEREYRYGIHSYDGVKLTFEERAETVQLQRWYSTAAQRETPDETLKRTISVRVLDGAGGAVVRTISCVDCYPVELNAGDHSTGAEIKTATLTCQVSRIEVA